MERRRFLGLLAAGMIAAFPAAAASFSDRIVQQLYDQGFRNISVEVTWLGRVRIRGDLNDGMREIILNPQTGEILRDLWLDADGNILGPRLIGSEPADQDDSDNDKDEDNSGPGGGGDDDEEDEPDDSDDDEADDDD